MDTVRHLGTATLILLAIHSQLLGQEADVVISDNSFLIEEAFNQEPGIVQHIFNWVPSWDDDDGRTREFSFLFTQEWPLWSQRHQLSYSVPLNHLSDFPDGQPSTTADGIGDVQINYRYQVWDGEDGSLAFAPRFSVILPTGDEDLGLGTGEIGYQVNLPFSRQLKCSAFHANAGLTATPNVKAGVTAVPDFDGTTANGYNLGASAIRFVKPNFHLMLESVALWNDELQDDGREDHTFELLLSPGFRWAPYTEGETQWVLGLGLPIGLSRDAPDISAFFYMSYEHRFARQRESASN